MTKEQAQLFFPYSPGDDLEDLWEQRLFEQKQFFLMRPPIHLVWKSKLKKLEQEYIAFLTLTHQEKESLKPKGNTGISLSFPNDFLSAFNQFHKERNAHKSELLKAQNYPDLVEATENWLQTELSFATYWKLEATALNDIEVIRSKEPDPMELLEELKNTQNLINSSLISDLKQNYNILSENMKKEVKRLTLLSKI
ncbi:hypothetical protein [Brumimicrobium oceani]|nr:hypothetical protein [Brumimicrobium oceani]